MLLFEEPHFSKKKISELHPTCPFLEFRIQPSTLGEKNSTPPVSYTPPWQLGPTCVLRLCKRAKACFQRPQPSKDAMALLKLTESWIFHDKISENCHGFQHENQYYFRSLSCDIAYVCILCIHACMYNICTLYIYIYIISFISICSDIFLQPFPINSSNPELRGPRPPCPQALPTRPRLSANHRSSDLSLPKRCCNLRDPSKRGTAKTRNAWVTPRVDTLRITWDIPGCYFFLGGGSLSWFVVM